MQHNNSPEVLRYALAFAARGWPVFPLRPASKSPATAQGFKDATTDPETVRRWFLQDPARGIGLQPAGAGLLVLDIDVKRGAVGAEELARLEAEHAPLPATLRAATPSGGWHLFFTVPEGYRSAPRAVPGTRNIDVRHEGGYVCVAPTCIDGRTYVFKGWDVLAGTAPDIAPAPHWLLDLLASDTPARVPTLYITEADPLTQVVSADVLDDLRSALQVFDPDDRDQWIANGQRLKGLGAAGLGLWQEWASASAKFDPTETDRVWRGFAATSTAHPAVFSEAQKLGWVNPRAGVSQIVNTRQEGRRDARDGTEDTHPLTELGNAYRLRDACAGRLHFLPDLSRWLQWEEDGRWSLTDVSRVRKLAHDLPALVYREGERHVHEGELFARWARKSQEARTVTAAVQMLADMPGVRLTAARLDADPMLCGLDGGRRVLDLRTGRVRPSVQADHITKSLAVPDIGDAREAVRWAQFIEEVTCGDAELADWLQRFLGYSLTGSTTEQCFAFLFGHGANGKSVLAETMLKLMGSYGASIQPATLCDDKRTGAGPSPDLARLDGIRFAVAAEAEEGSRFAESMLKALVSGDTIPVRHLNCDPFDMRPVLKLALTGNHKPHISGTDRGVWRRVRLVPFAASFEGRADPHLSAKLHAEFPHVLAWLVAGCLEWQHRGLTDTPRAIAEATEAYRAESDTLGQWLDECCTCDTRAEARSSDLYAAFQEWARKNGIARPWTNRVFGKKLGEYGRGWNIGERKGTGGARFRTGIALSQELELTPC